MSSSGDYAIPQLNIPRTEGKSLEITGENLEDLLAYDDLFLDFFNCFLNLPVFPQGLVYNRLTGAFDKVDRLERLTSFSSNVPTLQYGPTDAERENLLEWARKERLPLFLRSQMFRELKLVKLLLRPVDNDRHSSSRGSSRNIRGYSRAAESYISSLSVSGDNSGNDICDDDIWGELNYTALYRYQRPGSRALSLPPMVLFGSSDVQSPEESPFRSPNGTAAQKTGSSSLAHSLGHQESMSQNPPQTSSFSKGYETTKQKTRISNKIEVIPTSANNNNTGRGATGYSSSKSSSGGRVTTSSTEQAFLRGSRVLSAPISYEHFLKMSRSDMQDFQALFGGAEHEYDEHAFVHFYMEGISQEQTETDIRNMEGRLRMTAQEIKERVLGSHRGFEEFHAFLQSTAGEHLLAFWLECENFRDVMEDFDDIENMEIRNSYFKNIQDRFKLKLTSDALEQITRAAKNMGLSHTVFLRTQYDVLRRLRAYWVPRFLIHCSMNKCTRMDDNNGDDEEDSIIPSALPSISCALSSTAFTHSGKQHLPFISSVSLVHSMPVLPEDARDYANSLLRSSGHKNKDGEDFTRTFLHQKSAISGIGGRSLKDKFILALSCDKQAGGPFQRYLSKQDDAELLASLLFWEDVTEYGTAEEHQSDRLLRLGHAWKIYHKYLLEDSPHKIELPEKEREQLQSDLGKARDFIEASVFERAKILAVEKLEKAWIRYLKEDLKMFLDCHPVSVGESPPSTAEVIEVTLTEHDMIITRPMPWVKRIPGSTSTERARRLNKALILAEEIDSERRGLKKQEMANRRKEMERERRKAIRAAYARRKKSKGNQSAVVPRTEIDKLDDELPERRETRGERIRQMPTYKDLAGNKQVTSMFHKFVSEEEDKDKQNKLQLYNDIETYFSLKDNKLRKEAQASYIAKSYLDSRGKKFTPLNDSNIKAHIAQERDRPKSAVLREIQKSLLPEIEGIFQEFILKQRENSDIQDSPIMQLSELSRFLRTDQNLTSVASRKKSHELHSYSSSTSSSTSDQRESIASSLSSAPKMSGRAQATKEDKTEFLAALGQCVAGRLTTPILYFFKHLLKHGVHDGMPQIDRDLFFYIEVQKFKEASHNFADDEILRMKVQSIVECFLDSVYLPTLQINIPAELHQKTQKAAQRYLGGKEVTSTLFDEAQFHVFRELLFYWAGFMNTVSGPGDFRKRPVNKYDKMLLRRMDKIQNYPAPSSEFTLPSIPEGSIPIFNISLSEGVKFKEQDVSPAGTPLSEKQRQHQNSRSSIFEANGQGRR